MIDLDVIYGQFEQDQAYVLTGTGRASEEERTSYEAI